MFVVFVSQVPDNVDCKHDFIRGTPDHPGRISESPFMGELYEMSVNWFLKETHDILGHGMLVVHIFAAQVTDNVDWKDSVVKWA